MHAEQWACWLFTFIHKFYVCTRAIARKVRHYAWIYIIRCRMRMGKYYMKRIRGKKKHFCACTREGYLPSLSQHTHTIQILRKKEKKKEYTNVLLVVFPTIETIPLTLLNVILKNINIHLLYDGFVLCPFNAIGWERNPKRIYTTFFFVVIFVIILNDAKRKPEKYGK